jgi:hypothetical protein
MFARAILKSWRFAPSTARPMGTPPPSVRMLRLVPIFPRSVGVLPAVFPPQWRLGHGPIHGEPCPVNPLQGLVCHQTTPPPREAYASRRPLLEAAVSRATGTAAGVMQGIPWAPGAEDEADGIHGLAVFNAGPMASERGRLPWREQRLDVFPQLVGHAPITAYLLLVGIH